VSIVLKQYYPFGTSDAVEVNYYPMIEVEFYNMAEMRVQANHGNCDGGKDGIKYGCLAA